MKTLVLTAQPLDPDTSDRGDLTVRPLPKAADPAQAVRDGFIRGADIVALADVPLEAAELRTGLEALVESENRERFDVSQWLDEAREEGLIDRAHDQQSEPFDTALSSDDPALDSGDEPTITGGADDD